MNNTFTTDNKEDAARYDRYYRGDDGLKRVRDQYQTQFDPASGIRVRRQKLANAPASSVHEYFVFSYKDGGSKFYFA